jgi:hypothetical protein
MFKSRVDTTTIIEKKKKLIKCKMVMKFVMEFRSVFKRVED